MAESTCSPLSQTSCQRRQLIIELPQRERLSRSLLGLSQHGYKIIMRFPRNLIPEHLLLPFPPALLRILPPEQDRIVIRGCSGEVRHPS